MCTHNVCFEQKYVFFNTIFHLKIIGFTAVKLLQNTTQACLSNGHMETEHILVSHLGLYRLLTEIS